MDREALTEANQHGWLIDDPPSGARLDSSLKKNTAFARKLRTVSADTKPALLAELAQLSLVKYMAEVVSGVAEGMTKALRRDDVLAHVEVVSALHQRFGLLLTPLVNSEVLAMAHDPDAAPKSVAAAVEMVTEFYLVGLFPTVGHADRESAPEAYAKRWAKLAPEVPVVVVLKDVLSRRVASGDMLPVVTRFVKRYGPEQFEVLGGAAPLVAGVVRVYYQAMVDQLVAGHRQVRQLKRRNSKAALRMGTYLPEYVEELERAEELRDRFGAAVEVVAEVLGYEVPPPPAPDADEGSGAQVEVVRHAADDDPVFEDAAQRAFYTVVPTLDQLEAEATEDMDLEDADLDVTTFFAKLETLGDEATLAQLARVVHRGGIAGKNTHARIAKTILETGGGGGGAAPTTATYAWWARWLAVASPALGDVLSQVVSALDRGFRTHIAMPHVFLFIELAKFHLVPQHVLFHKIRVLTLHVHVGANLDFLSVFYEQAGRFLYHDREHSALMRQMVELLKETQKKSALSVNQKLAAKQLVAVVEPPPAMKEWRRPPPQLTPKQRFVTLLLGPQLSEQTVAQVVAVFRTTTLSTDPEVQSTLVRCFSEPEAVRYDHVPQLARVLKQVAVRNRSVLAVAIDTVIEHVKRGLELADWRMSRSRMAQCRYLGECFTAQLVPLKCVVSVCYKVLCSGHQGNQPLPGADLAVDPRDSFLRVHLVASVVQGMSAPPSFWKGSQAQAMRTLLTFFQYYIFCKPPMPVETQFIVDEVFEKYGEVVSVPRYPGLAEAVRALSTAVAPGGEEAEGDGEGEDWQAEDWHPEEADEAEDDDDDEEGEEEDGGLDGADHDDALDSGSESDTSVSDSGLESDEDDPEAVAAAQRALEDARLAAELDSEISRIMNEQMSMHLQAPVRKTNLAVPMASANDGQFRLMTRQGKKTEMRAVNMPADSKFAQAVRKNQEDQAAHRRRILDLVGNMED
ncbi:nonsense-mediated mRNA decay protein 2 [Diutina catenulata]